MDVVYIAAYVLIAVSVGRRTGHVLRPRCRIVRMCAKSLSKCDLLITRMRIEVYTGGGRTETVQKSSKKCDKVWNCVTI
jgi:hypothetical protein